MDLLQSENPAFCGIFLFILGVMKNLQRKGAPNGQK